MYSQFCKQSKWGVVKWGLCTCRAKRYVDTFKSRVNVNETFHMFSGSYADNRKISTNYVVRRLLEPQVSLAQGVDVSEQ